MNFPSKKISYGILAITALVCSRALFLFIDDPEGPNLLVVIVTAAIIFICAGSLAAYTFKPSAHLFLTPSRRLWATVGVQVLITIILFLSLR